MIDWWGTGLESSIQGALMGFKTSGVMCTLIMYYRYQRLPAETGEQAMVAAYI